MEEIFKISIEENGYPTILKKIRDPPKVLYFRGKLISKEECFAIVGTRRCSNYGKELALKFGRALAEVGLTIVSGLAPGIDTFSHLAAIERGKRTIAVLGTGVDDRSIYPKSNLKLAKRILEAGGALISEFPPGTHGSKYTFPKRNRIISGLSLGVLVIEARLKSGALITAKYAKEQKKKLFAVPGSVFSPASKGCHFLIKNGAKLVEDPKDILEELGRKKFLKEEIRGEDKEEELVLKVLREGALDVEKIIEKTGLSAQKVAATISILEIKGKIRNLGGNVYAIGYSGKSN